MKRSTKIKRFINKRINELTKFGFKTLDFVNLLDVDKRLSLTNSLLYASIIFIFINPTIDLATMIPFIITMLGYSHKRYCINKRKDKTVENKEELNQFTKQLEEATKSVEKLKSDMNDKVGELTIGLQQKNRGY